MYKKDLERIAADRIYVAPHIPADKLANALESYAPKINADSVLVLLDDTVWGGAREGMIVTENTVFAKELFFSPTAYRFNDIDEISLNKKSIYVDGDKFYSFNILEALPVQQVVNFIMKIKNDIALKEYEASQKQIEHNTNKRGIRYTRDDLKEKLLTLLSGSGNNFFREFQEGLLPVKNNQDKLVVVTTCKLMKIATYFPEYINYNKKYNSRFIDFLKTVDFITFEILIYISFKMQELLEPHLGHQVTCDYIEVLLGKCILQYALQKYPDEYNSNSLSDLLSDPKERIKKNPLMRYWSDQLYGYHSKKGEYLDYFSDNIMGAIAYHCNELFEDEETGEQVFEDIIMLLGEQLCGSLKEYITVVDKRVEAILCDYMKHQ